MHPSGHEQLGREREAHDAHLAGAARQRALAQLRAELASLGLDLALIELKRALALKYRADQPRVPAGNPHGGQWTDGSDGVDVDATGSTNSPAGSFRPGRHHFVPQSLYNGLPFPPETRKVFDQATTAPLQAGPHGWSQDHRLYNQAVREHLESFMIGRGIRPEQMAPNEARAFIDSVKRSSDPRIRGFNIRLYRREMLYWLRRAPRGD